MRETLLNWAGRLRDSAYALPLVVLCAGLMVGVSELGHRQATSRLDSLVLMGQSRVQILRVLRSVAEAESAQRGYLITSRSEYLAPYRQATEDVQDSLNQLRSLYQRQQEHDNLITLARLEEHVQTKLGEMREVLTRFDGGRKDTAHELMMSGIGRDQMVAIREDANTLFQRQNRLIERGLGDIYGLLKLNRIGIVVMTGFSLLALVQYMRLRRRADHERVMRQAAILEERDRLELEVARRTAELTDLARHLETTREDERARLARDLHDELGALLTAAKLDLARLRPKLQQAAPELMPRMAHLAEALNSGIALKRRIIEDLRPSSLSTLGLVPALEILCSELGSSAGLKMTVRLARLPLSPSCELTAFRLVQEAMNNIVKYAQAQSVSVSLGLHEGQALLQVVDDGVGFDVAQVRVATHGLVGMHYRVQADGGRLEVSSTPGSGTRIQARLPLQQMTPQTLEPAAGPSAEPAAHSASPKPSAV